MSYILEVTNTLMPQPKVNLLHSTPPSEQPTTPSAKPPRTPRLRRRLTVILTVFFILVGGLFIFNVVLPAVRLTSAFGSKEGFFAQLQHLTFSANKQLTGEQDDRVNVLLMGIGGEGHDGPLLTDTLMLASLQPSTGKAALVSLPRDLFVPYPDGTWRKINEAYTQGELANPGHGGEYATSAIGSIVGVNIPYYVVIDFRGFKQMIDEVGGVQINVERSFTDTTFPTDDDKGVHTVSFTAGWQWMNGEQALEYARSRHGNNGEGSDFARARRQQIMLLALKNRMLSGNVLLNPVTVNNLAAELASNISTNLEPWQIWRLYTLGKNITPEHVVRVTPDDSPGGLLVDGVSSIGAFILKPRTGNFNELQQLTQGVFTGTELVQDPPRIEIQNGTTVPGLANKVADDLTRQGYRIVAVTNAPDRTSTQTLIYDFTNGNRPMSLAALSLALNHAKVADGVPAWLLPTATSLDPNAAKFSTPPEPASNADFLIILGTDQSSAFTSSAAHHLN